MSLPTPLYRTHPFSPASPIIPHPYQPNPMPLNLLSISSVRHKNWMVLLIHRIGKARAHAAVEVIDVYSSTSVPKISTCFSFTIIISGDWHSINRIRRVSPGTNHKAKRMCHFLVRPRWSRPERDGFRHESYILLNIKNHRLRRRYFQS